MEPAPRWGEPLRPFLAAVMFLTRIPCPAWVGHSPELLARSTAWFPAVGGLVGGAGAAVFWVAHLLWPVPVAVVLSTAATVRLTGAFHEDALADACDGLGGGWTRERALEIMKDSRIGSYGAVGLILVLAAKLAALATLSPAAVAAALVAGHALGRWSSLPLVRALPYVREEGTGKPFAAAATTGALLLGTGTALAAAVPLGARALPALAAALAVTLLAGRYFRRRLGGVTGDCLGAANQLVELSVYLVLAAGR